MTLKRMVIALFVPMILLISACVTTEAPVEKIRDLDFTVMTDANIPEELLKNLEEQKAEAFTFTYADGEHMYICIGYGEQMTGGYSITVNELYLTEDAIYVDTSLMGPTPEEASVQATSYPYIVLQTEYIDKAVIFQ